MGLACSKPEGTSITVDTRRECRNSVLFPGPKLMVSQISELRAKLEESETALAEAKATIGALKATIDGFEANIFTCKSFRLGRFMSSKEVTCPVCSKKFSKGGCHPASQKLWQHMGHTDNLHLEAREEMRWNTKGWNGPWV